jgi:hypothetical protein
VEFASPWRSERVDDVRRLESVYWSNPATGLVNDVPGSKREAKNAAKG